MEVKFYPHELTPTEMAQTAIAEAVAGTEPVDASAADSSPRVEIIESVWVTVVQPSKSEEP